MLFRSLKYLDDLHDLDAKVGSITPLLQETVCLDTGETFIGIFTSPRMSAVNNTCSSYPLLLPKKKRKDFSGDTLVSVPSGKKARSSSIEVSVKEESDQTSISKKRINSWDTLEERTLVGIVFTIFLLGGTLAFRKPATHGRPGLSQVRRQNLQDPSWNDIEVLFNHTRKRQFQSGMITARSFYPRSAGGLRRKFKTLRADARKGQADMKKMFETWRTETNSQEQCLSLEMCLEVLYGINSCDHCRRVHTTSSGNLQQHQTALSPENEVRLLGAVIEKLFRCGTLVSSADGCTWAEISDYFQTPIKQEMNDQSDESKRFSPNKLQAHFKKMRDCLLNNIAKHLAGECDRGLFHLVNLYKEWINSDLQPRST